MRTWRVLLAALATFALTACFSDSTSSGNAGIGPTDPTSGNGAGPGSTPSTGFRALFVPLTGIFPYPTDLYFSGSTDGTLNIPASPFNPYIATVNALDGFSTTATITARFSAPIAPASVNGATVRMIQVTIDNATRATTGVVRPLTYGVDYTAAVSTEIGANNATLEITPLKPLVPSGGATDNGYLVVLTNGITDTTGAAASPDSDYAAIKAAQPTCATITIATLNAICRLTGAHLAIANAVGVPLSQVALTFSFSTQSISDTLQAVAGIVAASPPQPIGAVFTGLNTSQLGLPLPGHANIYVGDVSIAYYLSEPSASNPTAPLTKFWQAAGPSPVPGIDPNSRNLTRFNPVPGPTDPALQIPLLVTVPNANSLAGGARPPNGWPVVIFEHGITSDRTSMLAIADAFADAGFVVVAIDHPLHGITSTSNPFYQPTHERTFNLDLMNNTTGDPGPDGVIDSSGSNWINAFASPLTMRDNFRQAEADLLSLTRSLSILDLTSDGVPDIDMTNVHFVGHSLGGIVGGVYAALGSQVHTATLANPGGPFTRVAIESPTFAPLVIAKLGALGVAPNTTVFNQFLRDLQNAIDSGDPINYIAAAAAARPIHLIQVVGSATSPPDQVVPNSATARLILAGNLTQVSTPGPNQNAAGFRAFVNFTAGGHSSLLDPSASLAATVEMQRETVVFAATDGTTLLISDPTVVQ